MLRIEENKIKSVSVYGIFSMTYPTCIYLSSIWADAWVSRVSITKRGVGVADLVNGERYHNCAHAKIDCIHLIMASAVVHNFQLMFGRIRMNTNIFSIKNTMNTWEAEKWRLYFMRFAKWGEDCSTAQAPGTPRRLNIFMRRETNSAAAAAAGRAAAELIWNL